MCSRRKLHLGDRCRIRLLILISNVIPLNQPSPSAMVMESSTLYPLILSTKRSRCLFPITLHFAKTIHRHFLIQLEQQLPILRYAVTSLYLILRLPFNISPSTTLITIPELLETWPPSPINILDTPPCHCVTTTCKFNLQKSKLAIT